MSKVDRLKKILSDCASAIGNGSFASDDSSIEFLSHLPTEIRAEITKLKTERAELRLALSGFVNLGRGCLGSYEDRFDENDLRLLIEKSEEVLK